MEKWVVANLVYSEDGKLSEIYLKGTVDTCLEVYTDGYFHLVQRGDYEKV
jgi:hypothetical protein